MKNLFYTLILLFTAHSQLLDSVRINSYHVSYSLHSYSHYSSKDIDEIKIFKFKNLEILSKNILEEINFVNLNFADPLFNIQEFRSKVLNEILLINTEYESSIDTTYAYSLTPKEIEKHFEYITIKDHSNFNISVIFYFNDGKVFHIKSSNKSFYALPWIYKLNGKDIKNYNFKLSLLIQTIFPKDFANYDCLTGKFLAEEIAMDIYLKGL